MSYVVNWRGSDGQAGWHPVGDLTEAAAHVEHLRNSEGVGDIKIFQLEEVAFEFKQYYRVELATTVAEEPSPAFTAADPEPAPAVVEVPVEAAVEAPAEATAWTAEAAVEATFEASASAGDAVLAEVGADDGSANGQRRGLFGR